MLGKNGNPFLNEEVLKHLEREGFEFRHSVHSYAAEKNENNPDYESWGFVMSDFVTPSGWPISIFIRNYGIEVDLDYDCGGNYTTYFFPFKRHENFEETYDEMVDRVAELRKG